MEGRCQATAGNVPARLDRLAPGARGPSHPSTRRRANVSEHSTSTSNRSSVNGARAGGGGRNGAARDGHDQGLATRLAAELSRQVQSRVPRADLDVRDPDYIRERLPGLWLIATLWHRATVRGLDRIPAEGPVLIVGNHSGGVAIPDTHIFTLAFNAYFGVERRFHQLAHNLVVSMPGLGPLRKFGSVAASHENADAALEAGAALLVYPGGDHETFRPSWESARIGFGGRKGFVELALRRDVPIVPVVAIGGQETALFLSRGEGLARWLRLDRLFRLKILPVMVGVPFGLSFVGLPHIPLPAKITVEVLEPIHLREEFGPNPDREEVAREVERRMQLVLDRLARERRFPIVG
jgi:1-acyl-sn-glycerol-3-phosphate acyltransferase